MSGIYKGYNPIFESFKRELFEQESKIDLDTLDRTIYNTFVRVIQGGSDETIKTPEGFKSYMDGTLLKTSSLDGFQQEMLKKFDERIASDPAQKDALTALKTYTSDLFTTLKGALGSDASAFKGLLDKMSSYAKGTESDLQKLKTKLQENNNLLSKYLAEQVTGEEAKSEEGINDFTESDSFKAYKNLADEATSWQGEMASLISNPKLSGNPQIQKYAAMATKYLEDSNRLTMKRSGDWTKRIITASEGKINRKQYKMRCASLYNEIVRQREECNKIVGQLTNVPPPPPAAVICSPGSVWDKNANQCVPTPVVNPKPGQNTNPNPSPNTPTKKKKKQGGGGGGGGTSSGNSCTFPVKVGASPCDDIKSLQTKLSGIGSCVDDILRANGGIDGQYGKVTAKLANIAYAYLSGSTSFNGSGDLTKDMFDKIMAMSINESYSYKIGKKEFDSILEKNLFKKEHETGNPVISFDDFSKVLEQVAAKSTDKTPQTSSVATLAKCICETYKTGKISDECAKLKIGTTPGSDDKKKGTWKGLKPNAPGIYIINYDESTGEAILQVTVVTAGVTALVLTGGAAIGAYAPAGAYGAGIAAANAGANAALIAGANAAAAATALGVTSTSALLATGGAGIGAVLAAPVAIGAGTAAGLATSWWGGRCNVAISTFGGFISRTGMRKIARGMKNTTDGYVGHKDLTAIMATLCLLKGAWTCNAARDKALSAWGEFKRMFAKDNEIDIKSEINKIGTATVRDCKDFPDFYAKDLSEGDTVNSSDAKTAILEAIDRLDKNEPNMEDNIKDFTEEDIDKIYEGTKITNSSEGSKSSSSKEEKPEPKKGL
jgi:hypothetical protein